MHDVHLQCHHRTEHLAQREKHILVRYSQPRLTDHHTWENEIKKEKSF
jgi:hypothetical protein